jgi:hypothetical protein
MTTPATEAAIRLTGCSTRHGFVTAPKPDVLSFDVLVVAPERAQVIEERLLGRKRLAESDRPVSRTQLVRNHQSLMMLLRLRPLPLQRRPAL